MWRRSTLKRGQSTIFKIIVKTRLPLHLHTYLRAERAADVFSNFERELLVHYEIIHLIEGCMGDWLLFGERAFLQFPLWKMKMRMKTMTIMDYTISFVICVKIEQFHIVFWCITIKVCFLICYRSYVLVMNYNVDHATNHVSWCHKTCSVIRFMHIWQVTS